MNLFWELAGKPAVFFLFTCFSGVAFVYFGSERFQVRIGGRMKKSAALRAATAEVLKKKRSKLWRWHYSEEEAALDTAAAVIVHSNRQLSALQLLRWF